MPNVVKIVKGVAKAVTKKSAAAANKKGLKAANKGSMAPKGYKTDAERRKALMTIRDTEKTFGKGNAKIFKDSSKAMETIKNPAPKNVISKSGRVANTSGLKYKAAKKGK